MKVCGTCGKTFGDEVMFCLDDGTVLAEMSNSKPVMMADDEPTVVRSAAKPAGSSKFVMLLLGGVLLVGFVLITAAIGGGYLYYSSRTAETIARAEPTATQTPETFDGFYPTPDDALPVTTPTPTKEETKEKPTPSPTKTPKAESSKTPDAQQQTDDLNPDQGPVDYQGPVRDGRRRDIPRRISGGVVNGKATYIPKPAYPPAALAVRATGNVAVQVLIDESGNVIAARAVSGHPLLRAAATDAARRAKFSPTVLAGQPVRVSGIVNFNFTR